MLQFSVVSRLKYRMRISITGRRFTEADAAFVESTLKSNEAIKKVTFYTRTSEIAISHNGDEIAVRLSLIHI